MNNPSNTPLHLAVALAMALALPLAEATQRGTSPAGMAYASGGASDSERAALNADRQGFSFWLTTAVLGSGAYLADVKVRITEAGSAKLVLEHTMDGPWLFVALPAGRYVVEATCADGRGGRPETQRTTFTISAGDHHQSVLYFDTGDKAGEASPDTKAASAPR
jgi:hypothetical protein